MVELLISAMLLVPYLERQRIENARLDLSVEKAHLSILGMFCRQFSTMIWGTSTQEIRDGSRQIKW